MVQREREKEGFQEFGAATAILSSCSLAGGVPPVAMSSAYSNLSTCDRISHCCSSSTLSVLNLLDFILSILFSSFGLYLLLSIQSYKDQHVAWFIFGNCIVGALLMVVSSASFLSTSSAWCTKLNYFSAYLALFVALFALVFGSVSVSKQAELLSYLDSMADVNDISASNIAAIKGYYRFLVYTLFAVCALQLARFKATSAAADISLRAESEYVKLVDQEEQLFRQNLAENQSVRKEKYDGLRSYYRDKYSTDSHF